jgi:choline dehydrogenase-like flavoprotein
VFIDSRELDKHYVAQAEICIVGSGPAGLTIASRLARRGIRVALLESGGMSFDQATTDLYRGHNEGLDYYPLHTSRQRFFGGTSNHWGGWCRPLDPQDLKQRSWIAGPGWPLSYTELRPYNRQAEKILQLPGDDWSLGYWKSFVKGADFLDTNTTTTSIVRHSPPTRFAVEYKDTVSNSDKLTVYLHANVVGANLGPSGRHVTTLDIKTLSGRQFTITADQFVVAAGGIENARLLLSFNNTREHGLGNEHDLVGRYFSDHAASFLGTFAFPANQTTLKYYQTLKMPVRGGGTRAAITPTLTFTQEKQADARLPNFAAFMSPSHDIPDTSPNLLAGTGAMYMDLYASVEPEPLESSRVMLSSDRDALGIKRPILNFRLAKGYWDTCQSIGQLVENSLAETFDARRKPGNIHDVPEELKYGYHHMGTTRMHKDPKLGVVNENCRLHSVENMYVAGSSVFPGFGYAQPTLTITALALRLADHLITKRANLEQ